MRRLLFLVLIIVLAACGSDDKDNDNSKKNEPASIETLTVQAAYDQMSKTDGEFFVDVRTPEEWAAGHAEGATLIPLQEFTSRAPNELSDKNAKIYLICRSGNRSGQAAQILLDMGYTHVYNIDGGTTAWQQANLPIVIP